MPTTLTEIKKRLTENFEKEYNYVQNNADRTYLVSLFSKLKVLSTDPNFFEKPAEEIDAKTLSLDQAREYNLKILDFLKPIFASSSSANTSFQSAISTTSQSSQTSNTMSNKLTHKCPDPVRFKNLSTFKWAFDTYVRLAKITDDTDKKDAFLLAVAHHEQWGEICNILYQEDTDAKFDAFYTKVAEQVEPSFSETHSNLDDLFAVRCTDKSQEGIRNFYEQICRFKSSKHLKEYPDNMFTQVFINQGPFHDELRLLQKKDSKLSEMYTEARRLATSSQSNNHFTAGTVNHQQRNTNNDFVYRGTCYTCGGRGHSSSSCPSKKRNNNQNNNQNNRRQNNGRNQRGRGNQRNNQRNNNNRNNFRANNVMTTDEVLQKIEELRMQVNASNLESDENSSTHHRQVQEDVKKVFELHNDYIYVTGKNNARNKVGGTIDNGCMRTILNLKTVQKLNLDINTADRPDIYDWEMKKADNSNILGAISPLKVSVKNSDKAESIQIYPVVVRNGPNLIGQDILTQFDYRVTKNSNGRAKFEWLEPDYSMMYSVNKVSLQPFSTQKIEVKRDNNIPLSKCNLIVDKYPGARPFHFAPMSRAKNRAGRNLLNFSLKNPNFQEFFSVD